MYGVSIMARWKGIWLASRRTQVRSLASLGGVGGRCGSDPTLLWLGVGLQLQLWFTTPGLEISVCYTCSHKKQQTNKQKLVMLFSKYLHTQRPHLCKSLFDSVTFVPVKHTISSSVPLHKAALLFFSFLNLFFNWGNIGLWHVSCVPYRLTSIDTAVGSPPET